MTLRKRLAALAGLIHRDFGPHPDDYKIPDPMITVGYGVSMSHGFDYPYSRETAIAPDVDIYEMLAAYCHVRTRKYVPKGKRVTLQQMVERDP